MFNTLRSRILVVFGAVVLLTAGTISFFAQQRMEAAVASAGEQHARDLVNTVLLSVENEYRSLVFHREAMFERRKAELKNVVTLAITHLEEDYRAFRDGRIGEEEAQRRALDELRAMRYEEGAGYLFIINTDPPTPRVLMHPILPELEGTVPDAPERKRLVQAMARACREGGEGFVEYHWEKPTPAGVLPPEAKFSFVRLFREWGWIVGTGVYLGDIEKEAQRRLAAIIEELRQTFAEVRVEQTGYMFAFTGQREMLIHPNIAGEEFHPLTNPETGNRLVDELMEAAKQPSVPFDYLWDKPGHEGDYRFRKRVYMTYFEPFDWYIGSTMYIGETDLPARKLRERSLYIVAIALSAAFLLSVGLSRSLTTPLNKLARAAKGIEEQGPAQARIPVSGTEETRQLGSILDKMIRSIREAIHEKEEAVAALGSSNRELTAANERLQEEVAEREQAEQALRESEEKYRVLYDSSRDAIMVLHPGGRFVDGNPSALELFGCRDKKEFTSKSPAELSPDYQPDGVLSSDKAQEMMALAMGKGSHFFEWKHRRLNGEEFFATVLLTYMQLQGKTLLQATVRDITKRKEAEERLRVANRELEAFAYTVSHDLRTPLTPIIGYADFLRDSYRERLDGQALDCLNEISVAGGKMMALMEDLLTLAKVGQVERPAEPVDAGKVVDGLLCESAEAIGEAGVSVDVADLPSVRIPETLLTQVFDNLISNAVRYAGRQGGTVEVGGERQGRKVRFFVRDHGPGIPEQERERIFEVFFRGSTGKQVSGTGVGLATVQKIARLYGGRAWVEETPGGGSTFRVEMEDRRPEEG